MTAIESFQVGQPRLLIIGDLIIDRTIYCTVPKMSPEAPVPVALVEPEGIIETPGGAGLAASFAVKNNIPSFFLTAIQEDRLNFLAEHKINASVIRSKTNINPRKTRYIDIESNHHLLRSDTDKMMDKEIFKSKYFHNKIMENLTLLLKHYNIKGIVMLDYCKGMFDNIELTQWIIITARHKGIPTYVDSRSNELMKFAGANALKLNNKEADNAFNNYHLPDLKIDKLIVTLGKDGAELFRIEENGLVFLEGYSPDLNRHQGTPDVTGCGDVFDVTFCWNWCINGLSAEMALQSAITEATYYAYKPIKERLTC